MTTFVLKRDGDRWALTGYSPNAIVTLLLTDADLSVLRRAVEAAMAQREDGPEWHRRQLEDAFGGVAGR